MANKSEAAIFRAIDKFIDVAQKAESEDLFAVLCSFQGNYRCTHYFEYSTFVCTDSNIIIGLIDCVGKKYYISRVFREEDLIELRENPFKKKYQMETYDPDSL
jgi:hypothetical protein